MKYNKNLLLDTLANVPQLLEEYISNIPIDKYDFRTLPENWTIREHIYHIANVQKLLTGRIEKIHSDENPIIQPYFPQNETNIDKFYNSIESAFVEYKSNRRNQIEILYSLKNADFQKEAQHGEYIHYNIPIIMNHIIAHEYWHMYRIEELWLTKE